jgi:hypothetical protein
MLVMLAACFQVTPASVAAPPWHDFWLGFPPNLGGQNRTPSSRPKPMHRAGGDPRRSFRKTFRSRPCGVRFRASRADNVVSDNVTNLGIHITSDVSVTIMAESCLYNGCSSGIPTITWRNSGVAYTTSIGGSGSQLLVVGTVNGTTVTITPSVTVGAHPAGTLIRFRSIRAAPTSASHAGKT